LGKSITWQAKVKTKVSGEKWKKELSPTRRSGGTYIFCKLSGIITEADWKKVGEKKEVKVYLDTALEPTFGPKAIDVLVVIGPYALVAGPMKPSFWKIMSCSSASFTSEKAQIMGWNGGWIFYGNKSPLKKIGKWQLRFEKL